MPPPAQQWKIRCAHRLENATGEHIVAYLLEASCGARETAAASERL
jgi:hypothetical protein